VERPRLREELGPELRQELGVPARVSVVGQQAGILAGQGASLSLPT
jgi:hypothetical protein